MNFPSQNATRLANLSGPDFMVLYVSLFVVAGVALWILLRRLDTTGRLPPIPVPAEPDPYEVAYLSGAVPGVLQVAMVELVERGLLEAKGTRVQRAPMAPSPEGLGVLLRAILESMGPGVEATALLVVGRRSDLYRRVASECMKHHDRWLELGCFNPTSATKRAWQVTLCAIALLLVVAVPWMARGSSGAAILSDPIPLLVVWLIGSFALLVIRGATLTRLSKQGRRLLSELRGKFVASRAGRSPDERAAWDPAILMSLALFGASRFARTSHGKYDTLLTPSSD